MITTDGAISKDPNNSTGQDINSPDIDDGTINNTVIGGTTPAAGAFTTIKMTTGAAAGVVVSDGSGNLVADTTPALGTPSSGTVTNLTGTASININGTVGATTPAAITGTTITANTGFVGSITLPDGGSITLSPTLATDSTATGEKITATAGENLTFGNHCYLAADLKWYKCDSSTSATMPGKAIALGTINAAATGSFLKKGYVRKDSLWAAMTVGQDIYPSETAGSLTQTAPVPSTSATVCLQTVGHAPSTNTATVGIIWFDPSQNYQEIGVDAIDFGTATPNTILFSDMTAVPLTYLANHSSAQVVNFDAPVAADVGKRFILSKNGTGAGTLELNAPAGVTIVRAGDTTTDGGTLTLDASAYGSVQIRVNSATVLQVEMGDGGMTFA